MIIELYGLPGSGKSTIARYLAAHDPQFRIVEISGVLERLFWFKAFCIIHPARAAYWFRALMRNFHSYSFFRYKLNLLSISIARVQKSRCIKSCMKKGVLVIDEGLFQRILSIHENILAQADLEKIFRSMLFPDVLLVVQGGGFDRFLTYDDKHDSPRYQRGPEYMAGWIKVAEENHRLVSEHVAELARLKKIDVIEFDNSQRADLGKLVEVVAGMQ